MAPRYRLVVFDWDGTLVDSEERILACMALTSADLGLAEFERDRLRDVIGLALPEVVRALVPGADGALIGRFIEHYRAHYLAQERTPSALFEGTRETLHELLARGYLLAVATSKGRVGLDRALEETGCNALFHMTRCADEAVSKPHPRMLLDIMAALDVIPEQTVMVGDTAYDLEMARQAGTGAVAVSYGVQDPARLLAYNPLACLDRIADILSWLEDRAGAIEPGAPPEERDS